MTEAEREAYEERVAIMEYCGDMPRGEAQRAALERVLAKRERP